MLKTPPRASDLVRHFALYLQERYPPLQFALFHLLISFALLGLFRGYYGVPFSIELVGSALLLATLLFSFFFLLRVFDEHKDWEADRVSFPERVLSRGLIRLEHLRAAGGAAVLFMLGASLYFGTAMLLMTLLLLGYALLMLEEFFAGAWLRRHLLLYGISHNFVVFLAMHWCLLGFGLSAGHPAPYLDPAFSLAALAFNGLVFSLEVARKIRLPASERAEVDTYSKVIGYRAAALLAVVLHPLSMLLLALNPFALGHGAWLLLGGLFGLLLLVLLRFLMHPSSEAAARFVQPVSLAILGYLLVLALAAG